VIPAAVLERPARRVSKRSLARVFLRSLFLQAAWNPRGMQNLGFADAISPALEDLYPDPRERARAVARHLEFFNCHPYLAAAILGGAVRLEERVASGEAPAQAVSSFKSALGPPFAALGDGFFWLALRPAAALIAAATEPLLGLWCVAVFLVLYNAVHLAARVWLFATGYQRAEGVVDAVARAHMSSGTPFLKACGAALAGALAARGVLTAGAPDRPFHALLVGGLILVAWAALPRFGAIRAVYVALLVGLLLGAAFFRAG
jgi:PTS system mannose-specific IID component